MRIKLKTGVVLVAMISTSQMAALRAQPTPTAPMKPIAAKSQSAAEPLQIVLKRSKIAVVDGKEVVQSADIAKPGDILEEVATYTNASKSTLRQFEPTLPVPANTELQIASVKPPNAKASIDGINFAAMPLKRKVRQPNGVEIEQSVPLSEYKFLRWTSGDLAAEKSVVVSARFKVANDQQGVAPSKTN
jgi:hypothetical protein